MAGEVRDYLDQMHSQRRAIFSRLGTVAPGDWLRRPESGAWSIAENLRHASMAARTFLSLFRLLWPLAGLVGGLRRDKPYQPWIDDVYARPGFPLGVGWLWTPRFSEEDLPSAQSLELEMKAVHASMERFFQTKEEAVLGNAPLYDPAIGLGNYIQGLQVAIYHDAHHFGSVEALLAPIPTR